MNTAEQELKDSIMRKFAEFWDKEMARNLLLWAGVPERPCLPTQPLRIRGSNRIGNAKEVMQLKVVKSVHGSFFIQGRGFTGTKEKATRFKSEAEAEEVRKCAEQMGLGNSTVECGGEAPAVDPGVQQNYDGSSYAVSFIRKKDIQYDGSIRAHRLNPSKRRFRTEQEANQHGIRFTKIEKHVSHYVTRVQEPVNAYVTANGYTNPEIGRKRLYR